MRTRYCVLKWRHICYGRCKTF